jgi:DNA-binding FadR family transcriptional regulator
MSDTQTSIQQRPAVQPLPRLTIGHRIAEPIGVMQWGSAIPEELYQADMRFHIAVAAATQNRTTPDAARTAMRAHLNRVNTQSQALLATAAHNKPPAPRN